MVVTSYPISWERCLVLQMTAIKNCGFSVQASLMCWQSLKVINFQHPYSPVTLLFPNVTHPSFHSITPPLPNIYTPLTLSPILQPSLQTEGLPIFTQPLVVVIQLVVCWGHLENNWFMLHYWLTLYTVTHVLLIVILVSVYITICCKVILIEQIEFNM